MRSSIDTAEPWLPRDHRVDLVPGMSDDERALGSASARRPDGAPPAPPIRRFRVRSRPAFRPDRREWPVGSRRILTVAAGRTSAAQLSVTSAGTLAYTCSASDVSDPAVRGHWSESAWGPKESQVIGRPLLPRDDMRPEVDGSSVEALLGRVGGALGRWSPPPPRRFCAVSAIAAPASWSTTARAWSSRPSSRSCTICRSTSAAIPRSAPPSRRREVVVIEDVRTSSLLEPVALAPAAPPGRGRRRAAGRRASSCLGVILVQSASGGHVARRHARRRARGAPRGHAAGAAVRQRSGRRPAPLRRAGARVPVPRAPMRRGVDDGGADRVLAHAGGARAHPDRRGRSRAGAGVAQHPARRGLRRRAGQRRRAGGAAGADAAARSGAARPAHAGARRVRRARRAGRRPAHAATCRS